MRAARAGTALLVVVGITAAGVGWLYALRGAGFLAAGPRLAEALPLQRLAHGAAQPLLRLIVAWLPSGLIAGFVLRKVGWRTRVTRCALMFTATLALLLLAGAAADAVTETEPLRDHVAAQPQRAVVWLAAVLTAAGAAIP